MTKVTLSSKNQVVIPSAVRKRLGVGSGDTLIIGKMTATTVVFKKEPSYYDLIGSVKPGKGDAVERVQKLRDDWRD